MPKVEMSEPKEDPIEELLQFHDVQGALPDDELGRRLQAALNKAFPAIRALQERIKLNESLTVTGLITRLGEAEAKLARVIEIGDGMARSLTTEYGSNLTCVENWRKAVEE